MSEAAASERGDLSWRAMCGVAVLVLTLSVMALAQSSHHEDDPVSNQVTSGGAFGYADGNGRQVLVPVEIGLARGMKGFHKAVAVPGRVVDLTYAGVRRGVAAEAGGRNFSETTGALFAASGPVGADGDVLVATEDFLAGRQVLAVTPVAPRQCAAATSQAFAARSDRAVSWCQDVATVAGGGVLSLARFAPKGREELVTLAYSDGHDRIFLDYPGTADPDGTWRANDGGVFSLRDYRPLFAFRTKTGLELAVRWSGTEGEAMDLYRQEGNTFVPYVAATWASAGN